MLFELYAASRASSELIHAAMADAPLTPEEYAVYSVIFDEGPHAPTELAHRTGMPPTSMSHFVRAMLERGQTIVPQKAGARTPLRRGARNT